MIEFLANNWPWILLGIGVLWFLVEATGWVAAWAVRTAQSRREGKDRPLVGMGSNTPRGVSDGRVASVGGRTLDRSMAHVFTRRSTP